MRQAAKHNECNKEQNYFIKGSAFNFSYQPKQQKGNCEIGSPNRQVRNNIKPAMKVGPLSAIPPRWPGIYIQKVSQKSLNLLRQRRFVCNNVMHLATDCNTDMRLGLYKRGRFQNNDQVWVKMALNE